MAGELQGVWTQVGLEFLAAVMAGEKDFELTVGAIGDGGGTIPIASPSQTALVGELWRGSINGVYKNPADPTDLLVELVLPNNIGNFWIREWGVFNADGDLVAVGPHDEMHKPLISSGQSAEFLEVFHLPVSEEASISITVASQALATLAAVERMIDAHDEDENAHESLIGDIEDIGDALAVHAGQTTAHGATPSATPSRIVLRDPAGRAKVAAPVSNDDIARKAEVDAVLDEVGDVGDALATHAGQTTAHGGTATPTAGRIAMWDLLGRLAAADPTDPGHVVNLGFLDARWNGVLDYPGWVKLPNGLILQWQRIDAPINSPVTVSFPIAFPTACLLVVPVELIHPGGAASTIGAWGVENNPSRTTFTARAINVAAGTTPANGGAALSIGH